MLLDLLTQLVETLENQLFWRYAEESQSALPLNPKNCATGSDWLGSNSVCSAVVEAVARLTPLISFCR